MKLRKMMLNINGVDRMFMCDPENDKLSDVLPPPGDAARNILQLRCCICAGCRV